MSSLLKGITKKATKAATKAARRINAEDMIENPVPKGQASAMKDVGEGRAGKVAGGSEDNVMVNTAGKRTGMQREMLRTEKNLGVDEKKLKQLQADLKVGKGSRVKVFGQIQKVKEKIKLNKEKLDGKRGMKKRTASPTKKTSGGKIMKKVIKKANGGRMSRVGLSPAEESRAGVMSEAARRRNMPRAGAMSFRPGGGMVEKGKIMQGYKKGGQV